MRTSSLRRPAIAVAAVALVAGLGATIPAVASAAPAHQTAARSAQAGTAQAKRPGRASLGKLAGVGMVPRRAALPAGEHYVCPQATKPGQMECQSIIGSLPKGVNPATAKASNGDFGPSQLQSAYKLTSASAKKGKGVTIGIVDAFQDPNAAKDLARYRSHFHLKACTTGNKCLKIVNEKGKTSPLPSKDKSWAVEESLDLDMVSAICPNCHILLVEASSTSTFDLGTSEDTALKLGARYVSNSWSGDEYYGQDYDNSFFNHPGDVLSFAADDEGYGPQYPTDLQYVTAVGGTTLKHAKNKRGWTESAWGFSQGIEGTGSGCSAFEPKPSWQRADAKSPDGCLNRTETDVSADADPNTGALIYDSYKQSGFFDVGGTSEATPIITSVYALAGTPTRGSYPSEYPYLHTKDLFDVTSGVNGPCETFRKYLCHGLKGYDGPTGLGTPNGTGAFANGTTHRVALVDPGVQDFAAGSKVSIKITGLDTSHVSSLKWSASGLPAGLSIHAVSKSTNAEITGTLAASAGSSYVTVTGKDGSVTGTTHFTIVRLPSLAASNPPSGQVTLSASPSLCMDGGSDTSGQLVKMQTCSDASAAAQDWQYVATSKPGDIGTFEITDECLTVSNSKAPQDTTLELCNGSGAQQWVYLGLGVIWNPFTGSCLNGARSAGGAVTGANCNYGENQTWNLPAGPIVTGAGQLCLDNTSGSAVKVETCDYSNQPAEAGQLWTMEGSGQIESSSGQCLAAENFLAHGAITLESCNANNGFQFWETGPSGEMQNIALNSAYIAFNFCLADVSDGGSGTTVEQDQCYGYPGEIWGLN